MKTSCLFLLSLLASFSLVSCGSTPEGASSLESLPLSQDSVSEDSSTEGTSESLSEEATLEESSASSGPSFADIVSFAAILDGQGNFTLDYEQVISYGNGATETITEKDYVDGDQYLDKGEWSDIYCYLDPATGYNHLFYEDYPGKGVKDHRLYWGEDTYGTAFFISGYNYAYMKKSLSALLLEFDGTFLEQEGSYVSESVSIPIDMAFAQEFYSKSDGFQFAYFEEESYPDWALSHFTLTPSYEDGAIVSLTLTYDAHAIYANYGTSGRVDFEIRENDYFHNSFTFSAVGETVVEIPEGIIRA